MITSRQNPKIKEIRQLNAASKFRQQAGLYTAEGIRLLEECLQAGQKPELVIHTEELDSRGKELLAEFISRSIPCEAVTSQVMEYASDTESPQGMLAVLPLASPALPGSPGLVLVLDALRDPGNLGTLMRSCLAAGADGLLLGPGTVDPFSPKVVRAAMGAHFKLPVLSGSWPEIDQLTGGMDRYLADMGQGKILWEADLTRPVALILGGEAHGPGPQARQLAGASLHIPMISESESLNAAVAGAVLLFEVMRQRKYAPKH